MEQQAENYFCPMLLLLQIRLKQLLRVLSDAGFGLVLLAFVLTAVFWIKGVYLLVESPIWAAFGVSVVLVSWVHYSRRDKRFLESCNLPVWRMLLTDYLLLLSPLVLLFLAFQKPTNALACTCGILWCLVPLRHRAASKISKLPVPSVPIVAFEWNSLMRRRSVYIYVLLLIGLLSIVHISLWVLYCLFAIGLMGEAFQFNENRAIAPASLEAVFKKNKTLSGYLLLYCSIPLLLALMGSPTWWPFVLYGLVAIFTVFQLHFWKKQATWNPFFEENPQSATGMIAFISVLLPGFLLVAMGLAVYYFLKTKKRFSK